MRAWYAFLMARKDINEIAFAVVQQATGEARLGPNPPRPDLCLIHVGEATA